MTEPTNHCDRVVVASPPRLIGIRDVSATLGVSDVAVRHRLRRGSVSVSPGYLGVVAGRHTWNAHEFYAAMFTDAFSLERHLGNLVDGVAVEVICAVDDCDGLAGAFGICAPHLDRFRRRLANAERSSLSLVHLVAMARWIVERYDTVRVPRFDPWALTCAYGDCDTRVGSQSPGPLCPKHAAVFFRTFPR